MSTSLMDNLDFYKMRPHEIVAAKEAYQTLIGKHLSPEVADFLIKHIEINRIIN